MDVGKRRIVGANGVGGPGGLCALRARTKGDCGVGVSFGRMGSRACFGFSLIRKLPLGVDGALRGLGSVSVVVFTKNVSPSLRNRRVGMSTAKFGKNSQASVRFPTIRHGMLTTLGRTNGGIVLIGFSNSTVTLAPRAGDYSTVLRT